MVSGRQLASEYGWMTSPSSSRISTRSSPRGGVQVDEQVGAAEGDQAGGQHAAAAVGLHGREAVATERGQAGVAAGVHGVVLLVVAAELAGFQHGALAGEGAEVEPEFVAD